MSLIGKEVSEFKVHAFYKDEFSTVEKKDIMGKWSVFFFYPADFTFICPTELEDLQNQYSKFKDLGCEIYAVSTDSHFVHKAWKDASERIKKLEYPMLADPTHTLSYDFDVLIESDGQAERGTFVVNPEGKIVAYEVSAGNVGRNAEELLRKVQALQFVAEHGDEVCPAKWQPGSDTLKPSLDLVGIL
ncbi:MAG: peroxiredoxin [Lachnospiraceae bacterium]|nr:peroxiredoxin [Lachnospiraceae bacterium]